MPSKISTIVRITLVLLLSFSTNLPFCNCSNTDDILAPTSKANVPTFFTLTRLNKYVAFLDTKLPLRLSTFIAATPYRRSILSFQSGLQPPAKIIENLSIKPLPDPFEDQGLHSSFLVNFWQQLMTLAIVIVVALALILLDRITDKNKWVTSLRVLFNFNFIFIIFSLDIEEIIYYSSLEFKTFKNGTVLGSFSVAISIILFCLLWTYLLYTLYQAYSMKSFSSEIKIGENILHARSAFFQKISSLQILHVGLKDTRKSAKFFYFLYASRMFISAILGAYFYTSPIGQSIIQLILSVFMVLIILFIRPFTRIINSIQVFLIELIHLIANLGVLIVVAGAKTNNLDSSGTIFFADLVIILNIAANILVIFFLCIKLLVGIDTIWNLRKDPDTSSALWLHLLAIIIQQGAFGFEEIYIDERFLSVNKRTIHEEINHAFAEEAKLFELRKPKPSLTVATRTGSVFLQASQLNSDPVPAEYQETNNSQNILKKEMNDSVVRASLLYSQTPTNMKRTDGWRSTLLIPNSPTSLVPDQSPKSDEINWKHMQTPTNKIPFYYDENEGVSPLKSKITNRISHRASTFLPSQK